MRSGRVFDTEPIVSCATDCTGSVCPPFLFNYRIPFVIHFQIIPFFGEGRERKIRLCGVLLMGKPVSFDKFSSFLRRKWGRSGLFDSV